MAESFLAEGECQEDDQRPESNTESTLPTTGDSGGQEDGIPHLAAIINLSDRRLWRTVGEACAPNQIRSCVKLWWRQFSDTRGCEWSYVIEDLCLLPVDTSTSAHSRFRFPQLLSFTPSPWWLACCLFFYHFKVVCLFILVRIPLKSLWLFVMNEMSKGRKERTLLGW